MFIQVCMSPELLNRQEPAVSSVSVYMTASCAVFRGQLVSPIMIQKQLGFLATEYAD